MNDVTVTEPISAKADALTLDHQFPRRELVAVSVCSIVILTLTAFELWPIGWLEAWGFITGGICVWLTVKENVWTWPIGIANNIVFFALFWQGRLFADASLQIIYVALSVFGWLSWRRGTSGGRLEIRYASQTERLICIVFVIIATWILSHILVAANGAAPFWDALTTALSLAAQALMCRKRLDHWIVWIVADLVYVPLYFQRGLPLTSALYLVFLMLCIAGLKRWSSGMSQMGSGSK
jgi:nicotinamide mononucleotide transporter